LLLKLLPRHQANGELFLGYSAALPELAQSAASRLRLFEAQLLEVLGASLILPSDLVADRLYGYDWEQGPLPVGDATVAALSLPGAALIALRDHRAGDPALLGCRGLLQTALQRQLGQQRLHTPAMLRQLHGAA